MVNIHLVREAKEEANIMIDPNDLELVHIMNRLEPDYEIEIRERVDIFFKTEKWQGEPQNMEPDKCDELSWFAINDLPENTIPRLKNVLECIKNKINYSEFGFSK
jgi:8-oxo-dGTP diphosphatase